ncbi:MAG: hypothetical protein ACYC5N_08960 [Endomicrobiales bacterium]
MPGTAKITADHETIRKWVEARGGRPARVKATGSEKDPGLLRIDFPGYKGSSSLEPVTWEEFFAKFEEKNLAFLYQETLSSGKESRFFKFINRETAEQKKKEPALK